ncbi:hypothetical protein [Streptomyces sp. NPDC051776]|uniref:hypothetical protein n=1 Tax=Streptomyces sp. NPDC051776 TaxID=3155414 RepID=UPI003440BEC3
MDRAKLVGLGLAVTATVGVLGGTGTATASTDGQERLQADPTYKILKHLDYRGPGQASLRLGYYSSGADKGFGWTKVVRKHNITKYAAVEYIAKSPKRDHVGGQSYRETGYAGKYKCRNGVCHLVKQYKVLLTVNQKKLRDGQDKGVITQYCVGIVRCPNWVTKSLSKANRRAVATEGNEKYVGAYEPHVRTQRATQVKAGVNEKLAASYEPLRRETAAR